MATPTVAAATGSILLRVRAIATDRIETPLHDAVVWIPGSAAPGGGNGTVSSRDKRFQPRIEVVPVGGTVDFPNFDPINHNVFSTSEAARFDLGLYRNGSSKQQRFERPGVVPVFCNIHPQMVAYVVVVDGGIFARTRPDGTARLDGVSAGKNRVRIWHEKAGEWTEEVEVQPGGLGTPMTVVLDASNWREQAHKRKDGSDYPPPDDDENRY